MLFIVISSFVTTLSPTFLSKLTLHVLEQFLHLPQTSHDHNQGRAAEPERMKQLTPWLFRSHAVSNP